MEAEPTPSFNSSWCEAARGGGAGAIVLVKAAYALGICGNAWAAVALRTGERPVRNRKHLLLLTTLALNDLVALVGMLALMVAGEHWPSARCERWYCAARVALRVFGVGSGCIVVIMALERYLALTRPFFYHKRVTQVVIRWALAAAWGLAGLLTCAPVLGLGIYFDGQLPGRGRCLRYRNATHGPDFAYAVCYVCFGTLLCVVLVYCNMAVKNALWRDSVVGVRRQWRGSGPRTSTPEERTFSRLMITLAVLFFICWMPQAVTTTLFLWLGPGAWERLELLAWAADLLMLVHYVLDPLLYVKLWRRPALLARRLVSCLSSKKKQPPTSSESAKAWCCPQDTTLVSDGSSAGRSVRLAPIGSG